MEVHDSCMPIDQTCLPVVLLLGEEVKQKGLTFVFTTDPLLNVDINSTFDSIAVIPKFIQREIKGQLFQATCQVTYIN